MNEKVEIKNIDLSFYSESSMMEITSPVGNYFKDFPFTKLELDTITSCPEDLNKLIEELNNYFNLTKPPFQFPSGVVSSPHEIWIDKTRIDQLKNGFIPVFLWFINPNIPKSKGHFSWDV